MPADGSGEAFSSRRMTGRALLESCDQKFSSRSSVSRGGRNSSRLGPASRLGKNQFMAPQFELDDAHANYAAGLQSGMRISLICTSGGDVAKTPMSKDCAPAN